MEKVQSDEVIGLLKKAKVLEAIEKADNAADKKDLAVKLTQFAGQLNFLHGHNEICEAILEKSLTLDYTYAPTHYNLGVIFSSPEKLSEDEGNLRRAMDAYRTALKHDPEYHNARYNLALLYYFQGMLDECEREYATILEKAGDDIMYRDLGMLLMQLGRLKDRI
jgi:tetratricopeptide (TPR) repeat protein